MRRLLPYAALWFLVVVAAIGLGDDPVVSPRSAADSPDTTVGQNAEDGNFPDFPTEFTSYGGVREYTIDLGVVQSRPGHNDKLKVYLPDPLPTGPMPTVFIAPAGATSFTGKRLQDGDRRECLPYALVGFIVVAYELDGEMNVATATESDAREAFIKYESSQGGLVNAKNAMDYAIAHIPHVDSERLYTVGHSSAGTQALYWSVFEPRLKGVAAFAPVTEIDETELLPLMKFMPITFMSSARQFMPSTHYGRFHCPTFVVHGDADAVVPIDTTKRFVETLSQHGKQSTHLGFFNIGHFDVIDRGIPNVMVWLRDLAGLSDRPIPEPDQSVGTELKSDVLAAWRLEGHLIPAPTNNTCINRYRFNSPVSDTAYDKEQGTLYVARESGDLLAFQVESLNSGVTRCSKRWMESRKIDRVCLRTDSNRTLLAYWEDRGIVIQDLKTNSTLTRTPIEMAVDSGELDRHREICFTVGTDNGGLLVNHQGKNYEVDLGNFRLQNREIKSAFKMPFWRYESFNFPLTPSDSFEQRGYVNPFKIPNDLQERREIFQRVAVTAKLRGDSLSYSLWQSSPAAVAFDPGVMTSAIPLPNLHQIWSVIDPGKAGVFVSDTMVGIQSIAGGQVLIAEPFGDFLPEFLGIVDKRRKEDSIPTLPRFQPEARLLDASTVPSGDPVVWNDHQSVVKATLSRPDAWGYAKQNPNSVDLQFEKLSNARTACWIHVDDGRKKVVVVSKDELMVIDFQNLQFPLLATPPSRIVSAVEKPVALPFSADFPIQSARLGDDDILGQLQLKDGVYTWIPKFKHWGTRKLVWETQTDWGLERLLSKVEVQFPSAELEVEPQGISTSQHLTHAALWGSPGNFRNPVKVFDDSGKRTLSLDVQGRISDVDISRNHICIVTPNAQNIGAVDTAKSCMLTAVDIGAMQAIGKWEINYPIRNLISVGENLKVATYHRRHGIDRFYGSDVSVSLRLRTQFPDMSPLPPPLIDSSGVLAGQYGDARCWDGMLWTGSPPKQSMLLDLPKSYDAETEVRRGEVDFAGEAMLIVPGSELPTVLMRDDRLAIDAHSYQERYVAVKKGVYQFTLRVSRPGSYWPIVKFVPFRTDQPVVQQLVVPEIDQQQIGAGTQFAVSKGRVWVSLGKRFYSLSRSWFEENIDMPRVTVRPEQSQFFLDVNQIEKVSYNSTGASRYTLHLDDRKSDEALMTLQSDDGVFDIDLRPHINRFRETILHQIHGYSADLETLKVDWNNPDSNAKQWIVRQQNMVALATGQQTQLVPLELKALIIAENDEGERSAVYHRYIALLPNPTADKAGDQDAP